MKKPFAEIASNRFGLGAKPGQLSIIGANGVEWLLNQFTPVIFDTKLGSLQQSVSLFQERNKLRKQANSTKQGSDENQALKEKGKQLRQYTANIILDTLSQSIDSENSLNWRLLQFFSNHFSTSGDSNLLKLITPFLERDALAPHLYGQFEDLLIAVIQHPSMLLYLNNEKSFGPDSPLVQKQAQKKSKTKQGLNENLAREILELHTLGVHGGYSQQDIIELAKAITGWSVQRQSNNNQEAGYVFRKTGHQPGKRVILGKVYPAGMEEQGESILRDLAKHPSTATFLSFKLARHFIADSPTKELVNAMQKTWLQTGGNIQSVISTMIKHPDAWHEKNQKLKTPREFVISTYRAIGRLPKNPRQLFTDLENLGQMPFTAGSPAGYGDTAEHWNGGSAIVSRVEWANNIASRIGIDPLEMAESSLGKTLHPDSYLFIKRAESRQQAMALFLMSPDFQTR